MIHYLGNPAFPGHSVFPLKVSLHQGTNVRKVNCEEHSRGLDKQTNEQRLLLMV